MTFHLSDPPMELTIQSSDPPMQVVAKGCDVSYEVVPTVISFFWWFFRVEQVQQRTVRSGRHVWRGHVTTTLPTTSSTVTVPPTPTRMRWEPRTYLTAGVCINISAYYYYRPQQKLREGNVFTGVCQSVGGGVSQVPCSFLGGKVSGC